jgi:hypothetical protein
MVIHGEVVGEDRLRWSLEYRAMMCVGWCMCVWEVLWIVSSSRMAAER